jgi:hypothetical protein
VQRCRYAESVAAHQKRIGLPGGIGGVWVKEVVVVVVPATVAVEFRVEDKVRSKTSQTTAAHPCGWKSPSHLRADPEAQKPARGGRAHGLVCLEVALVTVQYFRPGFPSSRVDCRMWALLLPRPPHSFSLHFASWNTLRSFFALKVVLEVCLPVWIWIGCHVYSNPSRIA